MMLSETREVIGIAATVVHYTVYLEGEMIEDTFDWYAQDKGGNVWYLGEDVSNYKGGSWWTRPVGGKQVRSTSRPD